MATTLTPAGGRILDAASDLFYEHGITDVGVDLIAARAEVTKKTIYDRFGSKDALVVAYLEARRRRWADHLAGYLDRSRAVGVRRVLLVLDALEDWMAGNERGCAFVNAHAELSERSPQAMAVVRAEKELVRATYERALAEAGFGRRPALARQLALVHEGAIVECTAGGSARAMDDARAVVRRLLEA